MIAKVVVRNPSCYEVEYVRTEADNLSNKTMTVDAGEYFSAIPVETASLFHSRTQELGVQRVYIMFILRVTYADGLEERIVRRMVVFRPLCM